MGVVSGEIGVLGCRTAVAAAGCGDVGCRGEVGCVVHGLMRSRGRNVDGIRGVDFQRGFETGAT